MKSLTSLDEKSNELLSEGRKMIRKGLDKDDIKRFNEIFRHYKELEMQKEFCHYCLMFDYVNSGGHTHTGCVAKKV